MPIAARIPILKFGTGSPLATARTVSYTMERFTDYFSQNRPDAVLVLGDRYEIFAAGAAAALLEIPLARISGGDGYRLVPPLPDEDGVPALSVL